MKTKFLAGILLLAVGLLGGACSDDSDYTISMDKIISSIETGNAEVTAISATITGTVKDLSGQSPEKYSVGVCFSTNENPINGGRMIAGSLDEDGKVTTTIGGLTKGVTYFYCTYVTLQDKVSQYGEVKSFTTTDAQVGTADAASVTAVSVTLGGTLNGVSDMIAEGSLAYGIKVATVDNVEVVKGGKELEAKGTTNSFNIGLNGLMPKTTYYYMAYMILNGSYVYGDMKSFTTSEYEMEYVDMGLTVKWASCNLGATVPEELGGLYGWGDVTGLNLSTVMEDYGITENIVGTEYDICSTVDGRMPTFAEVNELVSKCNPQWVEMNGVYGCKFTARNGNIIFLPAAGYREGTAISDTGLKGLYWTGSISPAASDYAYTMAFDNSGTAWGTSLRYQGLSIRAVKDIETEGVKFDNYKLVTGDIENNGNFRMDIYNAWDGSGTDANCGLNPADIVFTDQIAVTFTLSGISVPGEYEAWMTFADGTWTTSNWGYNADGTGSVLVTGDGTYTVKLNGIGSGIGVFALDIKGLSAACGGSEGITATINKIVLDDWGTKLPFDNYKLVTGDIENKGNFRMDIYNEWDGSGTDANCGLNVADVVFNKKIGVTFTLQGITVPGEYKAWMTFADGTWITSNWGYNDSGVGSVLVTGDGTYTIKLEGAGSGVGVFAIDIEGLVTANGEAASDIMATVDAIRVE